MNSYAAKPVDAVDYGAMLHDKGYDKLKAIGGSSLFNDWGTTPIDEQAKKRWDNIANNYKVGEIDPYSFQPISGHEMDAAKRGRTLFGVIVSAKKAKISTFMKTNYAGEAKSSFSGGKEEIEFNYNLFLNKYMDKDSDGNYSRKDDMWIKSGDNYKPKP